MTAEKEKWSLERIHKEVSDARTKIFVVTKVLETGMLKYSEHPEWVVVLRPLLKDLVVNAQKVQAMITDEPSSKGT